MAPASTVLTDAPAVAIPAGLRHPLAAIPFLLGSGLVVVCAAALLLAALAFAFGFTLSPILTAGALVLLLLYLCWGARTLLRWGWLPALGLWVALLGLTALAAYVEGQWYDLSSDGMYYHQEAVIQLIDGWNPFHHPSSPVKDYQRVWVNHYPKGAWIPQALLAQAFGGIEYGKALMPMLMAAAFFLTFAAFQVLLRCPFIALAAAGVAALNPIIITQIFTYYVDGILAALLTALLACMVIAWSSRMAAVYLAVAAVLLLLVNIKFTGLFYAGFFTCAYLTACTFYQRAALKQAFTVLAISLVVGAGLIGFQPYVTNTISHGHPLYPVMGVQYIDVIGGQYNQRFMQEPRLKKLFLSLFSYVENDVRTMPYPTLRPYLLPGPAKLGGLAFDTRIGGFGQWFGPILTVSLALFMALLLMSRNEQARQIRIAAAVLLGIIASVLAIPECWWARFIPQLWLVPVLALAMLLYAGHRFLLKPVALVLLALLMMNVYQGIDPGIHSLHYTNVLLHQQLTELAAASRQQPLDVSFLRFPSNRVRLREAGVRFVEVPEDPSHPHELLIGTDDTRIYIAPGNAGR
jgi:hypothetical protein